MFFTVWRRLQLLHAVTHVGVRAPGLTCLWRCVCRGWDEGCSCLWCPAGVHKHRTAEEKEWGVMPAKCENRWCTPPTTWTRFGWWSWGRGRYHRTEETRTALAFWSGLRAADCWRPPWRDNAVETRGWRRIRTWRCRDWDWDQLLLKSG